MCLLLGTVPISSRSVGDSVKSFKPPSCHRRSRKMPPNQHPHHDISMVPPTPLMQPTATTEIGRFFQHTLFSMTGSIRFSLNYIATPLKTVGHASRVSTGVQDPLCMPRCCPTIESSLPEVIRVCQMGMKPADAQELPASTRIASKAEP
jgi:hypothetical protein